MFSGPVAEHVVWWSVFDAVKLSVQSPARFGADPGPVLLSPPQAARTSATVATADPATRARVHLLMDISRFSLLGER